jgi:uncharacterized membrane protein YgcG
MDVAVVAQDDALLDALGRGDPPPADDEVALLLAAWRADLASDVTVRPAVPPAGDLPRPRRRRYLRAALAAAAAVVAVAGGLVVTAGSAGPDSPLWSITRLLYADRADSRVAQRDAERAIESARSAVASSDYAEASRLLDEAVVLIGRVNDPSVAQRLLDEVDALRRLLPLTGLPPTPAPSPSPGSSGGSGPGGSSGGGSSGGGSGGPGGGPGLPLPSLPLPSLPLPSLSLPVIG